jgi:hypothetical protein
MICPYSAVSSRVLQWVQCSVQSTANPRIAATLNIDYRYLVMVVKGMAGFEAYYVETSEIFAGPDVRTSFYALQRGLKHRDDFCLVAPFIDGRSFGLFWANTKSIGESFTIIAAAV